ncbi:MAG: hypothetical protein P8K79_05880 [Mariniblastus sp.]|nr:hypothetical protein [Mariniblastus sp.]
MQRFFEFSFWMAEELIDLEVRFRPVVKPVKLRHVAADRSRPLERPTRGPLVS